VKEIHYAQKNYPRVKLGDGSCGETIASAGCKVTTGADIKTFTGATQDPPAMNAELLAKHIFVNHCLLPNDFLSRAYPKLFALNSFHAFSGPADLRLADNTPNDIFVELRIAWPHGRSTDNVHFLMVYNYKVGQPSGDLIVLDSYDGQVKRLRAYGDDPRVLITGIARWRWLKPAQKPAPTQRPKTKPVIPLAPTHPPELVFDVIVASEELQHSTSDLARARAEASSLPGDRAVAVCDDRGIVIFEPQFVYSFSTGDDTHPADQMTSYRNAVTVANDWSSKNGSRAIQVLLDDDVGVMQGHVVYDLPANVVPRT
jgi:hypothetical protein